MNLTLYKISIHGHQHKQAPLHEIRLSKMQTYLLIILSLLGVSYTLYIIMVNVLSQQHLFSESIFFTFGGRFELLGVTFENQTFYVGLCFFFYFNSVLTVLNNNVIDPVFSRLIYSHPDETEHHASDATLPKPTLYFILVFYDVWKAARDLFSLLGIFSNFGFTIATALGYVMSDLGIKYVYINWPELLNVRATKKVDIEAGASAIEADRKNEENERTSLLKYAASKFRI